MYVAALDSEILLCFELKDFFYAFKTNGIEFIQSILSPIISLVTVETDVEYREEKKKKSMYKRKNVR